MEEEKRKDEGEKKWQRKCFFGICLKAGRGREKKKRKRKMFVWFAFAKAEKWKEENVLFTLIPSLIGEVSKRPNRQNCNFERNKKSKNAVGFPFHKKL